MTTRQMRGRGEQSRKHARGVRTVRSAAVLVGAQELVCKSSEAAARTCAGMSVRENVCRVRLALEYAPTTVRVRRLVARLGYLVRVLDVVEVIGFDRAPASAQLAMKARAHTERREYVCVVA